MDDDRTQQLNMLTSMTDHLVDLASNGEVPLEALKAATRRVAEALATVGPAGFSAQEYLSEAEEMTVGQEEDKPWTEMRVGIEDGEVFRGYSQGELWNGWQCPVFTKTTAERVLNQFGAGWTYDEATDTFTVPDENEPTVPDTYPGMDIVVGGEKVHVYAIGAGWWIWEERTEADENRIK